MASILVIDDDPSIRRLMFRMLSGAGHTATHTGDARAAVDHAMSEPPDIVITDILMPEKEGMEVIRELRSSCPSVKIIAVSGGGRFGPDLLLDLAGRLGAHRVLSKPFRARELLETVDQVLAMSPLINQPHQDALRAIA